MSLAGDWFSGWLLVNSAIIAFVAIAIWFFMPKRIKQGMQANAVRLNGTRSSRRQRIEQRDAVGVAATTVAFAIPFLIMANAGILYTHARVAPIPMAAEAFQNFSWDKQVWDDRLTGKQTQNLSMRFQDWQREHGADNDKTSAPLVDSWPFVFAILCLMTCLAFSISARIYIAGLTRLQSRMSLRHQEYLAYDMRKRHQLVESGQQTKGDPDLANGRDT